MHKVLTSTEVREQLIQKGLRNAQKYSWEKSAKKLLNLFNSRSTEERFDGVGQF